MSEPSSSWQQHPGAEAEAPPNAEYLDIPGVRFLPSDQELIRYYLWPRIHGGEPLTNLVHEADVYAEHPKDLTTRLGKSVGDFWYVFSKRNRKYPKGKRPSRSTDDAAGRWKAVGKNLPILFGEDNVTIGHKCGLAFELFVRDDPSSRARTVKTEWKMFEYVAGDTNKPISPETDPQFMLLNDVVLCKITRKAAAAGQEAVLEDQGQEPPLDEPDEDEEQVPTALPPDPAEQARAQLMPMPYNLLHEGADGAEVGTERVADADLEQPGDGDGGATDVNFVDWQYHSEPWGDGFGGIAFDHDQWNQFGATTDPDPMVNHFHVPADPIELPSDPQSWDFASTLFDDDSHEPVEDEIVKANDDVGADSTAAANETCAPANADSQI
ncbi:unnamed protein product [Alopecurus aequalis]